MKPWYENISGALDSSGNIYSSTNACVSGMEYLVITNIAFKHNNGSSVSADWVLARARDSGGGNLTAFWKEAGPIVPFDWRSKVFNLILGAERHIRFTFDELDENTTVNISMSGYIMPLNP